MTTPNFIRLTRAADGKDVWVNVTHIEFVTKGSEGTVVGCPGDDCYHAVTESVDAVMKAILGEGGAA